MSKKVLLTGCAGYVGGLVASDLLGRGFRVLGVDSLRHGDTSALRHLIGKENFSFISADVRDTFTISRLAILADVIMPMAALVGMPLCRDHEKEAWEVNRDAVVNLIPRLSRQQKVVFPNTNSGYGATSGDEMVSEESPLSPLSVYARSKCEAEKAVLDHELSVSFRLATACGPSHRMRFDLLVNDFTHRIVNWRAIGAKLAIYEPHFARNFIHVRDIAYIMSRAADYPIKGVYNLGHPGGNMSKMELAQLICKVTNATDALEVGSGEDPDKRNYRVSNAKIEAWMNRNNLAFNKSIADAIVEVAQLVPLLTPNEIKRMANS